MNHMINRPPGRPGPGRQRGAVLLFAALGISALIVMASLIDLGLLYQYRREYQKTADLAALAGAAKLTELGCAAAAEAARQNVEQNLVDFRHDAPVIQTGQWRRNESPGFVEGCDASTNAIRVQISGSPPSVLSGIASRRLSAPAVAIIDQPIAALTIRSTVAAVSTQQSAVLNAVFGNILGGSLSLSVAQWEGLLQTDLNLLSYIDALAIELGVGAGEYDTLLSTTVTVGQLLDIALDVMERGGNTATLVAEQALGQFLAVPGVSPALMLGDLLNIATGTDASALDTELNLFELVQGSINVANGTSALSIDLPITTGLVNASVRIRSASPGQPVAIGNPDTDDLTVRTQNVRAMISLELGAVSTLTNVLNSLLTVTAPLLGPLTDFLNSTNLISGLFNLVGDLLCGIVGTCESKVTYIEALPQRIDVGIDLGNGNASVDDYSCAPDPKSLDIVARSSVGTISIGNFAESDFLDTAGAAPQPDPVAVIELGYKRSRKTCLLSLICGATEWEQPNGTWQSGATARESAKRTVLAGLGIRFANAPLVSDSREMLFLDAPPGDRLPDIGQLPEYQSLNVNENVVGSLQSTLGALEVRAYETESGLLSNVLLGTLNFPSDVIAALRTQVENVLAPLLNPVISALLTALGAQLALTEVGANLTCNIGGATLVQ